MAPFMQEYGRQTIASRRPMGYPGLVRTTTPPLPLPRRGSGTLARRRRSTSGSACTASARSHHRSRSPRAEAESRASRTANNSCSSARVRRGHQLRTAPRSDLADVAWKILPVGTYRSGGVRRAGRDEIRHSARVKPSGVFCHRNSLVELGRGQRRDGRSPTRRGAVCRVRSAVTDAESPPTDSASLSESWNGRCACRQGDTARSTCPQPVDGASYQPMRTKGGMAYDGSPE